VKGDFCYFDCLVAVTVSKNLRVSDVYVFPRRFFEEHEEELQNRSKRFSSATHRLIFVEKPGDTRELASFDKRLKSAKQKYKDAWHFVTEC
jgi:hypothetical protein